MRCRAKGPGIPESTGPFACRHPNPPLTSAHAPARSHRRHGNTRPVTATRPCEGPGPSVGPGLVGGHNEPADALPREGPGDPRIHRALRVPTPEPSADHRPRPRPLTPTPRQHAPRHRDKAMRTAQDHRWVPNRCEAAAPLPGIPPVPSPAASPAHTREAALCRRSGARTPRASGYAAAPRARGSPEPPGPSGADAQGLRPARRSRRCRRALPDVTSKMPRGGLSPTAGSVRGGLSPVKVAAVTSRCRAG
ncbi:hypothetical protein FB563_0905 [Streptomyces puniciscabiei]|uniref:Uncharacterized protein n=1 Tax=Streptomyces puniciscabiei TaxID=164348 RepID=A0A542UAA9_9ACTN|nr:hypothetical protein FB563_0905 [Streptomyces puniciscabiei]